MGCFGAVFGRRGDGGFNGCCSEASIGDDGFTLACISGRRGVIGFNVATWLCLCAKKFALRGLVVGVCAKKFALRVHNGPKLVFSGVPGELFRGNAAGSPVLGDFCRGRPCRARCGLTSSAPRASLGAVSLALWRSCSG